MERRKVSTHLDISGDGKTYDFIVCFEMSTHARLNIQWRGFPLQSFIICSSFPLSRSPSLYLLSIIVSVALYEIRQVNKIQSFVDFAYFDECSTRILLAGHIAHIFIATCTLSAQFITLMAPWIFHSCWAAVKVNRGECLGEEETQREWVNWEMKLWMATRAFS